MNTANNHESAVPVYPEPVFRPGELWLDTDGVPINAHGAGFLRQGDRTYWYGEHKTGGREGNKAHVGVRVYSSEDLLTWKNEGVAFSVSSDPEHDVAAECILERPKVIQNPKTGKFVMWFHLEPKGLAYSGARSGVAVADSPTGPFTYLGSFRPNAGVWPENVPSSHCCPLSSGEAAHVAKLRLTGGPVPYYPRNLLYRRDFTQGQMARDMTLFVDDDGAAYHIYASEDNGTLHISLLSEDYLRPAGRYVRVFPGGFHEAPAMFKHEGRYFLITSGCSGWAPNQARVSVANSIWGPWEELGNPCMGTAQQTATSFASQSTFVLPVPDKPGCFIFIGDRWRPDNAIDGRYIWLPLRFEHGVPVIFWQDEWDFGVFDLRPTCNTPQ